MVSVKGTEASASSAAAGKSDPASALAAPADCARRGRVEDAALGAESMVALLRSWMLGWCHRSCVLASLQLA